MTTVVVVAAAVEVGVVVCGIDAAAGAEEDKCDAL